MIFTDGLIYAIFSFKNVCTWFNNYQNTFSLTAFGTCNNVDPHNAHGFDHIIVMEYLYAIPFFLRRVRITRHLRLSASICFVAFLFCVLFPLRLHGNEFNYSTLSITCQVLAFTKHTISWQAETGINILQSSHCQRQWYIMDWPRCKITRCDHYTRQKVIEDVKRNERWEKFRKNETIATWLAFFN